MRPRPLAVRPRLTGAPAVSRAAGFTLMELLIALVLLSIMVVMLFGGLRLGARSWDSVEAQIDEIGEVRSIRGFIQRHLMQSAVVFETTPEGRRVVFGGTPTALEFVTPMPAHLGFGGLYLIRLEALEGDEGMQLRMTRWLYHPEILEGEGDIPGWESLREDGKSSRRNEGEAQDDRALYSERLLLDEVEKIEFSYFGEGTDEEAPSWQDEWLDNNVAPELVRLQLTGIDGW